MRAERDDYVPRARSSERRLAYEIALGIWLGGLALMVTSAVLWAVFFSAIARGLRFG